MHRFPEAIARGMQNSGAMTTCVPLQYDGGEWESSIFFALGGQACRQDRQILRAASSPLPIVVEADLISHANAGVVMLRFEVATRDHNPLVGEVLLTPGSGAVQFDTLQNLTRQHYIRWYFGDATWQIIHSQQTALRDAERQGYDELLREAVKHDAMIRLTGRYNAEQALAEVMSHYQPRA